MRWRTPINSHSRNRFTKRSSIWICSGVDRGNARGKQIITSFWIHSMGSAQAPREEVIRCFPCKESIVSVTSFSGVVPHPSRGAQGHQAPEPPHQRGSKGFLGHEASRLRASQNGRHSSTSLHPWGSYSMVTGSGGAAWQWRLLRSNRPLERGMRHLRDGCQAPAILRGLRSRSALQNI